MIYGLYHIVADKPMDNGIWDVLGGIVDFAILYSLIELVTYLM